MKKKHFTYIRGAYLEETKPLQLIVTSILNTMGFCKLVIAKYVFYIVFISCCYPCNAGFFSNVKGFFLDRLGRRKFSDDERAVESSALLDPRDTSAEEIILNLTTGNEILRTQVSSLKSTVNTQKKHISELKKEKEVSRRLMTAQLEKFLERQDDDRESIKRELREVFEGEKVAMVTTFVEEKRLLSEDYISEIRDIKLELNQQVEAKRVELEVVSESNVKYSKQIEEYEKSQIDFSKVQFLSLLLVL